MSALTLTDTGFDQEVLHSDLPVLVDFWGENCGPCRQLAPTIDSLASEYAGKLKVGKLHVGEATATAIRFHVLGIPTLLLFKGGKVVAEHIGTAAKSELLKMIEPWL